MMNLKTTYSFIILITFQLYPTYGQQFYVGVGSENAKFKDYVSSSGENTLDLSYASSQDILFEGGYRANLYTNRLKWNLGASYNKYQINTGFFNGNISVPLTYNLTYISLKTGVYFSIINKSRFKFQIHSHISHDWLMKGKSEFNNQSSDLISDNTFDKTLISFHKGISVEYSISENIATYLSYNNANSFREENKDSVDGEKYTLSTNAFSCGILFNIYGRKRTICHGGF
jgi:hypothetical protein